MRQDIINKLFTDASNRIDHITAVLKDHRDLCAAHLPPFFRRIVQQTFTVKNYIATADAAITRQAAHDSANDSGLPLPLSPTMDNISPLLSSILAPATVALLP